MLYDYGTVYNINTSDPFNSHVYLSWLPTGTNAINLSPSFAGSVPGRAYVEDDSNISEVSYLFGGISLGHLYVNKVSFGNGTGTSSIYLADTIEATPAFSYTTIGTKKVNDSLYYIYAVDISSTATDIMIDFRRISAISGGSSVDVSIAEEHISIDSGDLFSSTTNVIGRKIYVSIVYDTPTFTNLEGVLLCLDAESETITTVSTLSLPAITNQTITAENGLINYHGVVEDRGVIKWWIDYRVIITDSVFPFDQRYIQRVYFNGNFTDVFDVYPVIVGQPTTTLSRRRYKYNYKDTKVVRTFLYDGTTYYVVIDSVDGVSVATTNSEFPDTPPLTVFSENVFPKIGFTAGVYYWLDTNGKSTGAITLDNVSLIRGVYPTLDSINGCVYMNVVLSGINKIVSVDTQTQLIVNTFDLPSFPFTDAMIALSNHGNFFISQKTSVPLRFVMTYITDMPPISGVGDCQMIVEKN